MSTADTPDSVVLLGAGHTHLHVLKHWRGRMRPGVTLTCISDSPVATYSGMLTGVLAGDYPASAMEVPLAPLCDASGARLIVGRALAVDLAGKRLHLADGGNLPFAVLSVGVGSRPDTRGVAIGEAPGFVPIKPMQTFLLRLRDALTAPQGLASPLRVAIVGGGAAGVEIALCLPAFIRSVTGGSSALTLIADGPILSDCGAGLARRAISALDRAGVRRLRGRVASIDRGRLGLRDGECVDADVVIWATGAAPRSVLDLISLPCDSSGFLLTTDTLRSPADPAVFAVGDAGSIESRAVPKAGVHAVRQGPVLLDNLARTIEGRPLRRYRPQASFLKLLNAGGGQAIGEWRGTSFEGRWCRRLKDFIDTRFIAQFQR